MPRYWLGVGKHGEGNALRRRPPWWCLPESANPGDRLFLYRARSATPALSGLFAEYEVARVGSVKDRDAGSCGELGGTGYLPGPLVYSELTLVRLINPPVTATTMRKDLVLVRAQFVRRNFQGTTFQLKKHEFLRLVALSTHGD